MPAPKKPAATYQVRTKNGAHASGPYTKQQAATDECDRLNREAVNTNAMEQGKPLRYEIITNTGILLP